MRFVLTFLIGYLSCQYSVAAGDDGIRIVYVNMPPFIYESDGQARGPGADLIRNMVAGLPGFAPEPMNMPIKRLLYALKYEKTVAVDIAQIPERENLDLAWIGQVYGADLVFATLAGRPAINSVESAKSLARVGCNEGNAPQKILLMDGFTNLDGANYRRSEAAKLKAGRIDAWFDLKPVIETTWRQMGFDPDELVLGQPIQHHALWIAASSSVDPATILSLEHRFLQLQEQGQLTGSVLNE